MKNKMSISEAQKIVEDYNKNMKPENEIPKHVLIAVLTLATQIKVDDKDLEIKL